MRRSQRPGARIWARLSLAGAALVLLAALAGSFRPAAVSAAPSGSLSMSPGNTSIALNDTIGITFDVVGGQNVHRVLLTVSYNPAVVSVLDADSGTGGTQILPGAFPGTTSDGSVLQNLASAGTIVYEFALSNPSGETTGNGTVATATFQAIGVGNANLQWSTVQLTDSGNANSTPTGNAATLAVGQAVPTSTPQATNTATATSTATDTATPAATDTPVPDATDTPTPTETPDVTSTATRTGTPSISPTPAPGTATATGTATKPAATSTPRITVIDNSNKGSPPQSGVDPSQSSRANGLPSAGADTSSIQWWRWMFFAAALMLAIAGWFFTFALHFGDRETVLVDRHDSGRRRRKVY